MQLRHGYVRVEANATHFHQEVRARRPALQPGRIQSSPVWSGLVWSSQLGARSGHAPRSAKCGLPVADGCMAVELGCVRMEASAPRLPHQKVRLSPALLHAWHQRQREESLKPKSE